MQLFSRTRKTLQPDFLYICKFSKLSREPHISKYVGQIKIKRTVRDIFKPNL